MSSEFQHLERIRQLQEENNSLKEQLEIKKLELEKEQLMVRLERAKATQILLEQAYRAQNNQYLPQVQNAPDHSAVVGKRECDCCNNEGRRYESPERSSCRGCGKTDCDCCNSNKWK
jgi:hypothetical protein